MNKFLDICPEWLLAILFVPIIMYGMIKYKDYNPLDGYVKTHPEEYVNYKGKGVNK